MSGAADIIGLGRAMVLNPQLATDWLTDDKYHPDFPKFESTIPGGITAWYTMRLTALGEDREKEFIMDIPSAVRIYEKRDAERCLKWMEKL